jgi:hypothetical protein
MWLSSYTHISNIILKSKSVKKTKYNLNNPIYNRKKNIQNNFGKNNKRVINKIEKRILNQLRN